ncbi:hypothetical protein F0L68_40390 [Solihabitans fulvus]|uniref:Uncharacterized protein n=1 Tax=Solihabitans fulvus TaxID=1892852 RepID=A0A5B2WAD1_9PSEU|nr:hypothetical protein F0L68_40390 [Solihabitans fulvus]
MRGHRGQPPAVPHGQRRRAPGRRLRTLRGQRPGPRGDVLRPARGPVPGRAPARRPPVLRRPSRRVLPRPHRRTVQSWLHRDAAPGQAHQPHLPHH